jgi:hypothetical protein
MKSSEQSALTTLAGHHGWPAVSLYLPTHRLAEQRPQDRIRLRNLTRSAAEALVAGGMRAPEADTLLAPAVALVDDDTFWRTGTEGLAVFVSSDGVNVLRLGTSVPEQVVAGDRFYLRPLVVASRGDLGFFALAVDRAGCRLLRGDEVSIQEVTLEGVPSSLADELRYDEAQSGVQYSSVPAPQSAAGGGRPTGAIFHGHGGEKDTDKINLERYLRKIEGAVSKLIASESSRPLILMGVDYALAMYRSLNTSPSLVDEQVTGATDALALHAIHAKALEALQPVFTAVSDGRLDEITEHEGSAVVLRDVTKIVKAAATGRVKSLFFDDSTGPFGTFSRETLEVDDICADAPRLLREDSRPEDAADSDCGWDLVDLAAAETILNGGEVYGFGGEDAPVRGVVALLRY